jgi:N-acyl amino acid synthase of PEP-CTERM/exosortase system|tara:strand:- start:22755 stop:23585 length:831 start_codon:yes stop_codon:yes gene_type:complete
MKDLRKERSMLSAPIKDYLQFKSFSWLYNQLFETVVAESAALKEKAFRIRYEVLCEEFGYQEAERHVNKLERDIYDDHATHCLLIHKRSGEAIGTVRVVMPNMENLGHSLPIQEVFSGGRLREEQTIKNMCEISKLCILKKFRSRHGDERSPLGGVQDQDQETFIDKSSKRLARRIIPFAPIGLIKSCFDVAIANGYTQGCVLLEVPLIESFERLGLICQRIGPVIDHANQRQPIIIDFLTSINNMRVKQKAVWEMLTNNGVLHDRIIALKAEGLA